MTVRVQSEEETITLKKYLCELLIQQMEAADNYDNQAQSSAAMAAAQRSMALAALEGAQQAEQNALSAQEQSARCRLVVEQIVQDLKALDAQEARPEREETHVKPTFRD